MVVLPNFYLLAFFYDISHIESIPPYPKISTCKTKMSICLPPAIKNYEFFQDTEIIAATVFL